MLTFHLDESVNPAIAEGLRLRGTDCTTSREVGLLGTADAEQLAFAATHQRILVTTDEDFLTMATSQSHVGIVYWHQERRSIGEAIRRLVRLSEQYGADALQNRVMFL